jgi:hypothetical protein
MTRLICRLALFVRFLYIVKTQVLSEVRNPGPQQARVIETLVSPLPGSLSKQAYSLRTPFAFTDGPLSLVSSALCSSQAEALQCLLLRVSATSEATASTCSRPP